MTTSEQQQRNPWPYCANDGMCSCAKFHENPDNCQRRAELGIAEPSEQQEDRKLLELAARAAGIKLHVDPELRFRFIEQRGAMLESGLQFWNPRADDGDSRRLEVRLCMDVTIGPTIKVVCSVPTPDGNDTYFARVLVNLEDEGLNPESATRLAVLRAAAAIGEQMEKQA